MDNRRTRRRRATVANPSSALVRYSGSRTAGTTESVSAASPRNLERDVATLSNTVSQLVSLLGRRGGLPVAPNSMVPAKVADGRPSNVPSLVASLDSRLIAAAPEGYVRSHTGGSGFAGRSMGRDLVVVWQGDFEAKDSFNLWGPGDGAEFANKFGGKHGQCVAIRLQFMHDYSSDAGGSVRILCASKKSGCPTDYKTLLADPGHITFEFGKLPNSWIIPVPDLAAPIGATYDDTVHFAVAVNVRRRRNGLQDTDTLFSMAAEWLFRID